MSAERYERLMEALTSRVSCRRFLSDSVPEDMLGKVTDAALWTPSAHNLQRTFVVRIASKRLKERLRANTGALMGVSEGFDPFYGAPEMLAVLATGQDKDLCLIDGALTVYNMTLAASSLGLGSCWVNTAQYEINAADSVLAEIWQDRVRGQFAPPSQPVVGVGYVALGWPIEYPEPKPRIAGRVFTV